MKIDAPSACSKWIHQAVRISATIPHKYLAKEAELVALKWPTYRFMSPAMLNEMFRKVYNDLCKQRRPRNLDAPVANLGGIGPKLNFGAADRQLTQLHRARQHADRTGMPYDDYLRFCFDFAERRKRGHLPRPNQLKPSLQAEAAWFSMIKGYWTPDRYWVRLSAEAPLAHYRSENDAGLPAQISFREQLLFLAESNDVNPTVFYERVVLANRWLTDDHLPSSNPEIWARAKESAACDPRLVQTRLKEHQVLTQGDLMQSCYALPGIETATTEICATCPRRQECDQARSEVLQRVRDLHGFHDPVTAASREKNRRRVAKSRAKKKTAASFLSQPGG